jgi:hypothetical protein
VAVFGQKTQEPQRPERALVAHYNLNKNLEDQTGIQADVIPVQVEWTGDWFCRPNSAIRLGGKGRYIQIPDNTSMDQDSMFTISFWINMDLVPIGESVIFAKSDLGDPTGSGYWISISPESKPKSGTKGWDLKRPEVAYI